MKRICGACLCLLSVFCGCSGPQSISKSCYGNYDPSADYFPAKITVKYAANFDVSYRRYYKVVRTFPHSPDQDLTEASTFVLVQCGAPMPALEGELAGAFAIRIPAQTVALTLNEELAMVYLLGLAGRVVATGASSHYPEIRQGQKSGRIRTTGTTINLEALLDIDPDLVISLCALPSHETALREARAAGLPAVGHYSWLESTPLARAEWIKFVSLFFNEERKAEALFSEISERYETLAQRARAARDKPTVFWGTSSNDFWGVCRNDWQARLLEDAGAINLLADRGSPSHMVFVADEFVLDTARDADYWITYDSRRFAAASSIYQLKAFRTGSVYDPWKVVASVGGPEFTGIAGYRPDWMLSDLVSIFHPDLLPEHKRVFFEQQK